MGSIVADFFGSTEPFSSRGIAVTVIWMCVVVYIIFKFIFEKPWGIITLHRRLIEKNDKQRQLRIQQVCSQLSASEAPAEGPSYESPGFRSRSSRGRS